MPKFVHIRRVDAAGLLLPHGGLTIAYSLMQISNDFDIVFNVAACSMKDLFCHATGREVAAERLKRDGPLDILPGDAHPRAQAIVDWIADNYYEAPITITQQMLSPRKNKVGEVPRWRWESTFSYA